MKHKARRILGILLDHSATERAVPGLGFRHQELVGNQPVREAAMIAAELPLTASAGERERAGMLVTLGF